jgi:hypothetical protein
MSYFIATRTRRQLLTYAVCDTLDEAKQQLQRYSHIWRVHIYESDNLGYTNIVKLKEHREVTK